MSENRRWMLLRKGLGSTTSGLLRLDLAFMEGTQRTGGVAVVSGQPGKQKFRIAAVSKQGSMEPIPEGYYWLSDVEKAPNGDWGPGLGPLWIGIHPVPGMTLYRKDLGIHFDANGSSSPGSAGCIVATILELMERIAQFRAQGPKKMPLTVIYDLGTVSPQPKWVP